MTNNHQNSGRSALEERRNSKRKNRERLKKVTRHEGGSSKGQRQAQALSGAVSGQEG